MPLLVNIYFLSCLELLTNSVYWEAGKQRKQENTFLCFSFLQISSCWWYLEKGEISIASVHQLYISQCSQNLTFVICGYSTPKQAWQTEKILVQMTMYAFYTLITANGTFTEQQEWCPSVPIPKSTSPAKATWKCSDAQHSLRRSADSLMLMLSLQQQISGFVSNKHTQIKPPFMSINYILCTSFSCQWERCCKKSSSRMVKENCH